MLNAWRKHAAIAELSSQPQNSTKHSSIRRVSSVTQDAARSVLKPGHQNGTRRILSMPGNRESVSNVNAEISALMFRLVESETGKTSTGYQWKIGRHYSMLSKVLAAYVLSASVARKFVLTTAIRPIRFAGYYVHAAIKDLVTFQMTPTFSQGRLSTSGGDQV